MARFLCLFVIAALSLAQLPKPGGSIGGAGGGTGDVTGGSTLSTAGALPKVTSAGAIGEGILRDSGTSVATTATAGSETLAEASFNTATKWTLAGDFAAGTGKLTYTFSAGYGTALQMSTDFLSALETPGNYTFQYTVANSTATGAMVSLCDEAETWCVWGEATDGAHSVSVLIPGSVTGLYVLVTAESGGLDLTDVSVKAVGGRLYGKSMATTRLGVVDSAGDAGDVLSQFLYTVNPSVNTTGYFYNGWFSSQVPATNSKDIGLLVGLTNNTYHYGTGTLAYVDGLASNLQLRGPSTAAKNLWSNTQVSGATVTGIYALESNLDILAYDSTDASIGSGSAAYLRVSGGAAEGRTATLTNPKGLRILHEYGESGGAGTVTVTGPMGLGSELVLDDGAGLDSFKHINIGAPTMAGTAAISGTLYGMYIGAQAGATTANYNIFSAGASTSNKFEGNVDVGSFKLGTGAASGYVFVSDASGNGSWASSIGVNTSGTAAGLSATLTEAREPAHDGDVTNPAGDLTMTLADKLRTFTKNFSGVPDPVTADSGRYQVTFPYAVTILRVYCSTKDSGAGTATVDINLDERAESTPNTTGTSVLSAALVCDTGTRTSCGSGCDVNTITNASIAAYAPVTLLISATANTPTDLRVHFDFKID